RSPREGRGDRLGLSSPAQRPARPSHSSMLQLCPWPLDSSGRGLRLLFMRLWQDWLREMLRWWHLEEQLLVGVDGKWPGGRGSVGHHEVFCGDPSERERLRPSGSSSPGASPKPLADGVAMLFLLMSMAAREREKEREMKESKNERKGLEE
ncbi:hypothetical protein CRG98_017510, partial [Punica granatum]